MCTGRQGREVVFGSASLEVERRDLKGYLDTMVSVGAGGGFPVGPGNCGLGTSGSMLGEGRPWLVGFSLWFENWISIFRCTGTKYF